MPAEDGLETWPKWELWQPDLLHLIVLSNKHKWWGCQPSVSWGISPGVGCKVSTTSQISNSARKTHLTWWPSQEEVLPGHEKPWVGADKASLILGQRPWNSSILSFYGYKIAVWKLDHWTEYLSAGYCVTSTILLCMTQIYKIVSRHHSWTVTWHLWNDDQHMNMLRQSGLM